MFYPREDDRKAGVIVEQSLERWVSKLVETHFQISIIPEVIIWREEQHEQPKKELVAGPT
jgi:hypothetical protein